MNDIETIKRKTVKSIVKHKGKIYKLNRCLDNLPMAKVYANSIYIEYKDIKIIKIENENNYCVYVSKKRINPDIIYG